MIRAEHVYKVFGDRPDLAMKLLDEGKSKPEILAETGQVVAGQDISFEQRPGELFVIMGLSGSGKSTFLRCVNRLVEPTSGKIFLTFPDKESLEVTSLGKHKLRELREKYISMVFQSFALFPHRTVLSNVTFSLEIQGVDKKKLKERGVEILKMVGLEKWGDSYPAQLSGGMQQRVGLARALVTGAPVVLMDEAFSALDPLIRVNMQDELLKLHEQFKRTNLFVTHDLDEALRLGDRIALMEQGLFVQVGTPEEILVNPKTEYVERFVEHADPSHVVTAGTIATRLERLSASGDSEFRLGEADSVFVDAEGHPTAAVLNGVRKPITRYNEAERTRTDCYFSVTNSESIHTVMKVRISSVEPLSVSGPVFTVDGDGRLSGVITERNILQGLLEKGRQTGGAQE